MQILMVRGVPTQVSDEDFEWASQYTWRWGNTKKLYVCRGSGKRFYYLHHEIWRRMGNTVPSGYQLDHKDQDKTNNQRDNLRVLTVSSNSANRKGVKGCSWSKVMKKWHAQIMKNYKHYELGYFETQAEAIAAYEAARRQLYPELYV